MTLTKKIFGNMKRGFRGVPRPLLPAMLLVTNPNAGQAHHDVAPSQPSSSTIPVSSPSSPPVQSPPPIPTSIPASTPTPIPKTDPEPTKHTFEEPSLAHQHFSPPQEHAQEQVSVDDLLQLVPQLMIRVASLEKDLKKTKLTMGSAIVKLVKKVKKRIEEKDQRNLLSDSEEEETEAQGRKTHDLDPLVSLVQELVTPSKTPSKTVNASGEEQVEDISPTTLEAAAILTKVKKIKSVDKGKRYKRRKSSKESAGTGLDFEEVKSAFGKVSTGGIKVSSGIEEINTGSLDVNTGIDPVTTDSIRVSVPSPDRGRREGKAPMTEEEETQASRKTKEQILQEEAGLAEAIRLDALEKALEKEEVAKQVHLDSLLAQRMAEEPPKEKFFLTRNTRKRKAQVQFEA
ncbi:hypothetical protein Tco_1273022 [Tanacetum coccineum]